MMAFFNKRIRLMFFILVLIITTAPLYAETGNGIFNRYGGHMMNSWDMGWMMLVFWSLLLICLVLVIRWLLFLSSGEIRNIPEKSPLEILKERLAIGEIEISEFEEKKKMITE